MQGAEEVLSQCVLVAMDTAIPEHWLRSSPLTISPAPFLLQDFCLPVQLCLIDTLSFPGAAVSPSGSPVLSNPAFLGISVLSSFPQHSSQAAVPGAVQGCGVLETRAIESLQPRWGNRWGNPASFVQWQCGNPRETQVPAVVSRDPILTAPWEFPSEGKLV